MIKLRVQGNHICAGTRTIGHVQGDYIYSCNNLPIVHVKGNYFYGGNDLPVGHIQGNYIYGGNNSPVGTMAKAQSLIDGGKEYPKNILAAIYLLFRK